MLHLVGNPEDQFSRVEAHNDTCTSWHGTIIVCDMLLFQRDLSSFEQLSLNVLLIYISLFGISDLKYQEFPSLFLVFGEGNLSIWLVNIMDLRSKWMELYGITDLFIPTVIKYLSVQIF